MMKRERSENGKYVKKKVELKHKRIVSAVKVKTTTIRPKKAVASLVSCDDDIGVAIRNLNLNRKESERQNNTSSQEHSHRTCRKSSKRVENISSPKITDNHITASTKQGRKRSFPSPQSDSASPEKIPKVKQSSKPRSPKQETGTRKLHAVEHSHKGEKAALNETCKTHRNVAPKKTPDIIHGGKNFKSKTPSSPPVKIVIDPKENKQLSVKGKPRDCKVVLGKTIAKTLDSNVKGGAKLIHVSQELSGIEVDKQDKLKKQRKHSKTEHHKEHLESSTRDINKKSDKVSIKQIKKALGKTTTKSSLSSPNIKNVKSPIDKKHKVKGSELLSSVHKKPTDNINASATDSADAVRNKKTLYSPLKVKQDVDGELDIESDTDSDNILYSLSPEIIKSSHVNTHKHVHQKSADEDTCKSHSSHSEAIKVKHVKDKGHVKHRSKHTNRSPPAQAAELAGKSKDSKKATLLLDGLKTTATSESVPVRPVSPTPLLTTVKPVPVLGGASSQAPVGRAELGGDILTYKYVVQPAATVLPISPASMSYQVLMENLPHQLHPRRKGGRPTHDEEVERRVSVRSSECAFKYKEIIVKKCPKYTQIWLHTHTEMRNALNPQVMQEIVSALNAAKYDDSNLVMFSGLGNVFCSGIDLHFLTTGDRHVAARQMVEALRDFTKTFITFPKLIVAVVTGPAMGLGMAMLPLCDVVYASDKATFHLPYSQLGQTPEGGASYTLPHCIGIAMANELLFSGRKITAIEACQLGLISQVYWPTSMMQEVIPRIQNMAQQSGKVLETTKLLVRSHQRTKLDLTNESESNLLLERWPSAECQKAITEYLGNEKNYCF